MRRDIESLEKVQEALSALSVFCYLNVLCEKCVFMPFCESMREYDVFLSLEDFGREYGNIIDEILARKIR